MAAAYPRVAAFLVEGSQKGLHFLSADFRSAQPGRHGRTQDSIDYDASRNARAERPSSFPHGFPLSSPAIGAVAADRPVRRKRPFGFWFQPLFCLGIAPFVSAHAGAGGRHLGQDGKRGINMLQN